MMADTSPLAVVGWVAVAVTVLTAIIWSLFDQPEPPEE